MTGRAKAVPAVAPGAEFKGCPLTVDPALVEVNTPMTEHNSQPSRQERARCGPARRRQRRHHRTGAQPVRDPGSRRGLRTPPVPGTVWDFGTRPVDAATPFSTPTLERITTSFSTPGDQVTLLAESQATPNVRLVSPRVLAVECELVTAAAAVEQLDRRCHILAHPERRRHRCPTPRCPRTPAPPSPPRGPTW